MRGMIAILTTSLLLACSAIAGQPQIGDAAPQFRLQDQNGNWQTLGKYRGQWVTLYFYPKDDTPGCTTEACAFRDDIFKFKKLNVAILGVSLDDVESHVAFAEKYHLPFPLLADTAHNAAMDYGVVRDMGVTKIAKRETFVIDPEGKIALHYEKVDPDNHSQQLQSDLATLMQR